MEANNGNIGSLRGLDPALLRYFDRLAQSFLLQIWLLQDQSGRVGGSPGRMAEHTNKAMTKTSEVDYRKYEEYIK
jgi:hypothetical protein